MDETTFHPLQVNHAREGPNPLDEQNMRTPVPLDTSNSLKLSETTPRVIFGVQCLQSSLRHLSVDVGCANIRMAQHGLDAS